MGRQHTKILSMKRCLLFYDLLELGRLVMHFWAVGLCFGRSYDIMRTNYLLDGGPVVYVEFV